VEDSSSDKQPILLEPDEILEDKYRVVRFLGRGGMGSVHEAIHTHLGNRVAIKLLHPRLSGDEKQLARFQREAHIISGLRHKNILSVYGFHRWRNMPFMAMEFIEGESIRDLLIERQGNLSATEALPLFLQICQAMQFAHNNSVLHRDLKPDNVLVVKESDGSLTAKVVDFGLAKLQGTNEMQKLTSTGQVVGDPHYMSPEQCQGTQLDARSDIYSFGCLMYEVLTGARPFLGDSPVATMYEHLQKNAKPFAKQCGLPLAIEGIVFKAIAKDPRHRYQSFEGLAADLEEFSRNPQMPSMRAVSAPTGGGMTPAARSAVLIILLGALICLLYVFSRPQAATDPYANISDSELRARAVPALAKARDASRNHEFEQADSFLATVDELRKHLNNDPYLEGRIDYQHGEQYLERFRVTQNKEFAALAKQYLLKADADFKRARASLSATSGKTQLHDIEWQMISNLDMLLAVGLESSGSTAGDEASQRLLEELEQAPPPLEYMQGHSVQKAFNWLFTRRISEGKPDAAAALLIRKIDFSLRQDSDTDFIAREKKRMLSEIAAVDPVLAKRVQQRLEKRK
jgi:serine/threonine protein kinase